MVRLIDADALKSIFTEKSTEAVCGAELCKAIISIINDAPTVDAEPVRHGKWLCGDDFDENGICSECEYDSFEPVDYVRDEWKYCPNCGARMDEGKR